MTDDATLRAHDERRDFASARARFRALTDAPGLLPENGFMSIFAAAGQLPSRILPGVVARFVHVAGSIDRARGINVASNPCG